MNNTQDYDYDEFYSKKTQYKSDKIDDDIDDKAKQFLNDVDYMYQKYGKEIVLGYFADVLNGSL
tara:strand:+ start:14756 stop:14947 length:192 start_codon:yes stop_codon:yes gene_type:complete